MYREKAFSFGGGNQCQEKTTEFQQVIDLFHYTILYRIHGRKTTIPNLIKTMFGSSLPSVVCRKAMSYLRYLCLLKHIVLCFCFVFVLCVL